MRGVGVGLLLLDIDRFKTINDTRGHSAGDEVIVEVARRLAEVFTTPKILSALGPVGMRSDWLMTLALRWMGNLITEEDRDRSARVWRWAGRRSVAVDARPPFS